MTPGYLEARPVLTKSERTTRCSDFGLKIRTNQKTKLQKMCSTKKLESY